MKIFSLVPRVLLVEIPGNSLTEADLRGADLSGVDLSGVDLSGVDLDKLVSERSILPEGILIGWKKLDDGSLCKLRIPENAKRVGGITGRKCRADVVEVLKGSGVSSWDGSVKYAPGVLVHPKEAFDPNPLVECASGIHFFITKHEAEKY